MTRNPSVSSDSEDSSKKRPSSSILGISRSIAACQRCRTKKIRCDQNFPACAKCAKSGVECVGLDPATGREVPRSYVIHLEDKIAELEILLRENGIDPEAKRQKVERPEGQVKHLEPEREAATISPMSSAPTLVGASSDVSFSRLMFSTVNFNNAEHDPSITSSPSTYPALLPPKQIAQEYLKIYFAQTNSQLPILHREQFIAKYWDPIYGQLGKVSLASDYTTTSMPSRVAETDTWDFRLRQHIDAFQKDNAGGDYVDLMRYVDGLVVPSEFVIPLYFLNIIFAVASSALHLQYPAEISDGFRSAALRSMDVVYSSSDRLESLQGILLLTLYSMMRPAQPGVWYVLGSALRLCVDLGLQNESGNKKLSGFVKDMRRRLFWCTYSLDRQVCVYLGRPFGIPEGCVNTQFPSELDDMLIVEDSTADYSENASGIPTYKVVSLAMFKIRQIQAEIQQIMYEGNELPRAFSNLASWSEYISKKLDNWRLNTPNAPRKMNCDFNLEFFNLSYNHTLLMLHGLSPRSPKFSFNDYRIATEAGKQVIITYDRMLAMQSINYTWVAVHNLFMAGASYLYSVYTCDDLRESISLKELKRITNTAVNIFQSLRDRCDAATTCKDTFEFLAAAVFKIKYGEVHGERFWGEKNGEAKSKQGDEENSPRKPIIDDDVVASAAHMGNAQLRQLIRSLPQEEMRHQHQLDMLTPVVKPKAFREDEERFTLNLNLPSNVASTIGTPTIHAEMFEATGSSKYDLDRFFEELDRMAPMSLCLSSPQDSYYNFYNEQAMRPYQPPMRRDTPEPASEVEPDVPSFISSQHLQVGSMNPRMENFNLNQQYP